MNSFKSSENIQKKEGGPDRSVLIWISHYAVKIIPGKAKVINYLSHTGMQSSSL